MSYHVALDLSQEQVRRLKLTAVAKGRSVRGFVTDAVLVALDEAKKRKIKIKKEETIGSINQTK